VTAGKLNTGHDRCLGANEVAQLVGDGAEHLGGPGTLGCERGHPPQRGVLIGKLAQPCLAGRTADRPRADGVTEARASVWRAHGLTIARCLAARQ
jgi:hypothetical protein